MTQDELWAEEPALVVGNLAVGVVDILRLYCESPAFNCGVYEGL